MACGTSGVSVCVCALPHKQLHNSSYRASYLRVKADRLGILLLAELLIPQLLLGLAG